MFKSALVTQFIIAFAVNLGTVNVGWTLAWTSPVVPILSNPDTSPVGSLTADELSWIVSLHLIVGVPGAIAAGFLANKLGRKKTMVLVHIPKLVGWFLAYYAYNKAMMYSLRLIHGLADAILMTIIPMYITEISSKEIRGALGAVMNLSMAIGNVLMLGLGPFLKYDSIQLIGLGLSFVALITAMFVPESPYFNYMKGNTDGAVKSLRNIRPSDEEIKNDISIMSTEKEKNNEKSALEVLKLSEGRKSFVLSLLVALFQNLGGVMVLMMYLQTIFESTNTNFGANYSSLFTSMLLLLGSLSSLFLTDKLGRKALLCSTSLLMAVGMAALGAFFFLLDSGRSVEGFWQYVPIISIGLIVFGNNAGYSAISFPLISELLPDELRSVGMSCAFTITTIEGFLITKFYPSVLVSIGAAATYWSFGLFNILAFAFILVFIPETKNVSLKDIQDIIFGRTVHMKCCA